MLRHKLELGGPKGFKKHGTQRLDLVIELVRLVNEHSSQPLVGLVFFFLACFGYSAICTLLVDVSLHVPLMC